jgi:hypothetical protein
MATISNTPRPGYVWDSTDNVWYPIGVGAHNHDTYTQAQADALFIPDAIVTTKGDLIVATGSGTVVRQGVGANGTVLTANSAQADGVEWTAPAAGGMTLLSTTSLSGATTTISSINQTYKTLVGYVYGVTNATANGYFRLAPNGSLSITTSQGTSSNSAMRMEVNEYIGLLGPNNLNFQIERTNADNFFSFEIIDYAATTNYKSFTTEGIYNSVSDGIRAGWSSGGISTNSAITSLVFSNVGGNLSTGTVELYGVK